jgi:hypothetical protein
MARGMGVSLLPMPAGPSRELDMASLIPKVSGQFLWLVPGGTIVDSVLAAISLRRVIGYMAEDPNRSFYSDGSMCFIYRVEALRALLHSGHKLPANTGEMARVMQQAGYELAADSAPEGALCRLEEIFGGPSRDAAGASQMHRQKLSWLHRFLRW